jgi:ABC-type glycerol-3-phosphate transport system substrate-binding protein
LGSVVSPEWSSWRSALCRQARIHGEKERTMKLTRRDLLKQTGAAGAGVAGAAVLGGAKVRRASAQEKVKLNVWKAPHNDGDQAFWNERLAQFMAENPTVEVEYRITPWATWEETYTAAFASDSPPDISYVVDSFYPKYADAGTLADLATLPGADLTKWQPLFDPTIWNKSIRGGKTYGLPFLQAGISFVWNKKLFREAGLDPETPPKTWDELVEFAKKLTKSDGSQWGYSTMDDTTGEMLNFVTVPIVNYGGELSNADDTEWTANAEGHVQGLQLQMDTIQKDKTAPPLGMFVGHDIDKAFLDGKIAMQLSYSSFLIPLMKDYPDFEIGISMPPAGPANDFSLGGIGYWMMAEKSQHKAEAWKLMEFLGSGPVMSDYANLTRLFHTRTDINPFEGDPVMEGFAATQRNYMRFPALAFGFWPLLMAEVAAALNGQVSAQDALDTAAKRINDRIKEG